MITVAAKGNAIPVPAKRDAESVMGSTSTGPEMAVNGVSACDGDQLGGWVSMRHGTVQRDDADSRHAGGAP